VARLIEQLSGSTPWESRLHILQMLPDLEIPTASSESLFQSLTGSLSEQNKFVRAWVYTALETLASQHEDYRPEVSQLLERATIDEAPSVRARLRQLKTKPRSRTKVTRRRQGYGVASKRSQ
jgi:hypothetical protein